MAGYGDADEAIRQLERTPESPDYAVVLARVTELNESLSRLFDQKCNRTGTAVETRTIDANSGRLWWSREATWSWPDAFALILPSPILSVTAITEGGDWDGATWTDETTLEADDYRLTNGSTAGGFYRIERMQGTAWSGAVRITGTWVDAAWPEGEAPPEVVDAVTFLIVAHYREDAASPAGVVGPDGMLVPTRSPWPFQRVQLAIDRYRVREVIV